MAKKKLRQRGYNQSLLLAHSLVKLSSGKVDDVLKRTRDTKPQYGLSKEERLRNMHHAFALNTKCKPQNLDLTTAFLVDDVVTTGATLVEAANVIKRNGFKSVWGITFVQD